MTKKFLKLFLVISIITAIVMPFSVCFAEQSNEELTATTTESNTEENAEDTSTTDDQTSDNEIFSGDLYLFDNDIVMDKMVDGNAFIFGNNVKITGQVNGNLFVFANKLSFDGSYVRYSIFACANSIFYNGACNDLYVASNNIEMTYDSYVVRDVKTIASSTIFKSAIGRNADIITQKIDFGTGEENDVPAIYGNLNYSAREEKTLNEGVVQGTTTYNALSLKTSKSIISIILNVIVRFLVSIATTVVIYIFSKLLTPKFSEQLANIKITPLSALKSLGVGLLAFIAVFIVCIILLFIQIGVKLAFLLFSIFMAICLISVPVLIIIITNMLKPVLKLEKTFMFYLALVLLSIIAYGLTLIPFAGVVIAILIKLVAVGTIINILFSKINRKNENKENETV